MKNNTNNIITNNYSNKNSKLEHHNNNQRNHCNNSNSVKNVNSTTTGTNSSVALAGCLMPNTSSSSSSVLSSSIATDSSSSATALASVRTVGPAAAMLLLPRGGSSSNSSNSSSSNGGNSSGYHSSNAVTAAAMMTAKLAKAGSFLSVVPPAIPSTIAIGGINRIGGGGSDRAFVLGSQTYATSHLTAANVLASAVAAAAAAANVVHHQQQRSNYTTSSLSRHLTKNLTSNASLMSKRAHVSTAEGKPLLSKISSASKPSAAVSISNSETITNTDTSINPAGPAGGIVETNAVPPVVRTLVATVGATNTIATLASPVPSAVLLTTSSSVNSNHCSPSLFAFCRVSVSSVLFFFFFFFFFSGFVFADVVFSHTQRCARYLLRCVACCDVSGGGSADFVDVFARFACGCFACVCAPLSLFVFRSFFTYTFCQRGGARVGGRRGGAFCSSGAFAFVLCAPCVCGDGVGLVGPPLSVTVRDHRGFCGGAHGFFSRGEGCCVFSIVHSGGGVSLSCGCACCHVFVCVGMCEVFCV
uniref:Uncharacterized protein n=1 Tax=Anopheles triannulatus TaxID=58253 RepID=A0A2M4A3Z7_9DIPT